MAQARDEAGNIWETDAQGNAIRLIKAAGPSPLTIGTPNPAATYEAPKAAAEVTRLQQQIGQTARTSNADVTKANAEAQKAVADAKIAEITAAQGGQGKNVSPEVRQTAIGGFRASEALQRQIDEIRSRFNSGPGSTKGVAGLRDFLPTSTNRTFNDAANAARAFGGPVLGFTASQLNTEKEQQRAIGPYIPAASDYDEQALAKINRLQGLVDLGRSRSVQILGGIPDAAGNVQRGAVGATPNTTPPAGPSGPGSMPSSGGGGPAFSLATGGMRNENDPELSSRLEGLIRSGATAEDIARELPGVARPDQSAVSAVQTYLKAHPEYTGFGQVNREVPNGIMSQVAASPLGAFVSSAADAVIPMKALVDEKQGAAFDQLKRENPGSSLAGMLVGGIPAAAGAEMLAARAGLGATVAPRVADAIYGGIQGAGNAADGEGVIGGLEGAAAGLVGGAVGRTATRGVGRVASGVQNDAVNYLRGSGIPLTAGQALGGTAKQLEDQATGLPFIGGIINARRTEGMQGFNRAAFDEALAPIGESTNGVIGAAGIDLARAARGRGYGNALDGVNVMADAPFVNDMQSAIQAGRGLPDPMGTRAGYTLDTRVGNSFGPNGELSGNGYQQSIRGLRRDAKSMASEPYGYDFGQVTGQAEDALNGILTRQAPDVVPAVGRANQANMGYETIRDAVNKARNGTRTGESDVFAPSQLADAAASTARKFGNNAGTTNQPFFDLTRAGQEVLPSKVGDSGTAGRNILGALLGGTAAGAGGFLGSGDSEDGIGERIAGGGVGSLAGLAGLGGLAALGGSRGGQRALLSILADRPDLLRTLGGGIQNRAGVIGAGGIPLALQLQQALTGN